MPEQIEQVLKAIHVLFSRSDSFNNSPDRIVISKREMFDLLEKLNYAVVDVMDQYEATTRTKEKAKQQMEQLGQNIIDEASQKAEDVYAASMLYTDGALNDLYDMIEDARKKIKQEQAKFDEQMLYQLQILQANQTELMSQLSSFAQGKKYLDIIDEYNESHVPEDLEEESPDEEDEADNDVDNSPDRDEDSQVEYLEDEKTGEVFKKPKTKNKNVAGTVTTNATKNSKIMPKKEPPIRKIAAAPVEPLMDGWEVDTEPVRAKIEVKVHVGDGLPENSIYNEKSFVSKKDKKKNDKTIKTENHTSKASLSDLEEEEVQGAKKFSANDFNLDAEYEQWKDASSGTEEKHETIKDKWFNFVKKK